MQCGGSVELPSDGISLLAQDRVHGWTLWHGSLAGRHMCVCQVPLYMVGGQARCLFGWLSCLAGGDRRVDVCGLSGAAWHA